MPLISERIAHGYGVVRMILDDLSGRSIPVGVVVWDADRRSYATRFPRPDEKVPDLAEADRQLVEIAAEQIHSWAESGDVPYAERVLDPWSQEFWVSVSRIMKTGVYLKLPRAIEPLTDVEAGIEALFEAVVQPKKKPERPAERIDGAVSKALGKYAGVLPSKPQLEAFGGLREQVIRGIVHDRRALLVDGVNLAASSARRDADALVSKLRRIRTAYQSGDCHFVVGYLSTPTGLNGEAAMGDWIRREVTPFVFDLGRETEEFREAVEEGLRAVRGADLFGSDDSDRKQGA